MDSYSNPPEDNSLFITKNVCTEYLWDEVTSLYCDCGHSLPNHSRNDDTRHGRCVIRGCPCTYFTPYRVKKPKRREWESSW